ncbi:50S ribosomal protein L1 [Candidatus Uhrbacteria bacterium RIFOXYB12_FULL_58_10]|uniref:Large ribosomal subunit protein uL1 n=1 Tax=Candidatus Uhrbacteria bacterium RIFOXYB2_FULL_57_15 TaxID=1802422 RepID=A0A1F7W7W0_9BACT|nr:MAG: 50S ribosomal protein L1 [Candidatus Uhrbacteria bacterium RIFOXYB12_FULL_58_10]OGL98881.1 MAG: 50S ribosomal protein L1 [Candidatus Uhrbacteria bacterium RIFOXYB2_FULL_57_15]
MAGKRIEEARKLVDAKRTYTLTEAIALVKQFPKAGFDEAVELHVKLGIDPTKGDQQVRGTIAFPHGVGKSKRVAAFVEAAKEADAKAAGADIVGGEELINEIATKGTIDFDVAVATPAMMPKIAKLAKLLGPKGLMPNPKNDTVGPNVTKMIQEQKAGKQSFKNDTTANIHQIVGRVSMTEAQLRENIAPFAEQLRKLKPASAKGIYFRNASLTTTMGPGVKIDMNS